MKHRALIALSLVGSLLTGCQATHLVYVYDLSVGVDVAYSQQGNPKLVVGYDRGTYAIVPQKENKDATGTSGELMSAAAVSSVKIDGLSELKFNHFISTGACATAVAQDADGLAAIRTAIFGQETK